MSRSIIIGSEEDGAARKNNTYTGKRLFCASDLNRRSILDIDAETVETKIMGTLDHMHYYDVVVTDCILKDTPVYYTIAINDTLDVMGVCAYTAACKGLARYQSDPETESYSQGDIVDVVVTDCDDEEYNIRVEVS